MRQTKKQTRADLSPMWTKISRTDNYFDQKPYLNGVVRVERVYHRGRTGPAWTPSYSFYFNGIVKLQSDSLSTFVDQIHRFVLEPQS